MEKLLLRLTLLVFSSGVLCNVVPNLTDTVNPSLDQMKIVNSSECGTTADSDPGKQVFITIHHMTHTMYSRKGCVDGDPGNGFVVTPGIGAHKLHKRARDWNEARKSCSTENAVLAVINSEEEGTMLMNTMKKQNVDTVWIGIHDYFKEGDWVTVTGETLEAAGYDRWLPGEPNNVHTEHCGTLTNRDGMNDLPCDTHLPYFCKIKLC